MKNFEVRPDVRILPVASTYDRKNSPTRVQWPLMSILLFAAAPLPRAPFTMGPMYMARLRLSAKTYFKKPAFGGIPY